MGDPIRRLGAFSPDLLARLQKEPGGLYHCESTDCPVRLAPTLGTGCGRIDELIIFVSNACYRRHSRGGDTAFETLRKKATASKGDSLSCSKASGSHLPNASCGEDSNVMEGESLEVANDDYGKAVIVSGRVSVESTAHTRGLLERFLITLALSHPDDSPQYPVPSPYLATN